MQADIVAGKDETENPSGNSNHMGNHPPRRSLSPTVAASLAEAHRRYGLTYHRTAAMIGIDTAFWWRLCHGRRAPSTRCGTYDPSGT